MRGRRSSSIPFIFIFVIALIMVFSRRAFDTRSKRAGDKTPSAWNSPDASNVAVKTEPLSAGTGDNQDVAQLLVARKQDEDVMVLSKVTKRLDAVRVGEGLKERPTLSLNYTGTRTCYGLCSPENDVEQADYVSNMVQWYMSKFKMTKTKNNTISSESRRYEKRKRRHRHWTITEVNVFGVGTQPKLVFQLAMAGGGNRTAVFKPKIYSRWKTEKPCSAFDRYNAELGAYYFRRTMQDFVKTTRVVGVRLDLKRDVWPVRDEQLKNNSWVEDDGRYCVKFECKYCYNLVLCGADDTKSVIDGSLSFWALKKLDRVENPWSSTCTQRVNAKWRLDAALCPRLLSKDQFFGDRRTVLDAVDAGVFDFLVDNPDRHTFEYWQNETAKEFVLLDNGKAFPDPHHDDLTVAAALFQCCMIRERTYSMLRQFSDTSYLTSRYKAWMASDPVYPFLGDSHVLAVARRIKKTLVVIELCIERYGSSAVLLAE